MQVYLENRYIGKYYALNTLVFALYTYNKIVKCQAMNKKKEQHMSVYKETQPNIVEC